MYDSMHAGTDISMSNKSPAINRNFEIEKFVPLQFLVETFACYGGRSTPL